MKVLHITNWFPSETKKNDAIWIKKQIDSISSYVENYIYHFEIIPSKNFKILKTKASYLIQLQIKFPCRKWAIIEILYFLWLVHFFLIKRSHKNYDVINFHIAYPMLTYWHLIKRFVNKPIVVTEHWSAYHFNFGVEKKLYRIQNIFKNNFSLITVSEALKLDIDQFSQVKMNTFILPNIVNTRIFYFDKTIKRENQFFMVSQWKKPKSPFLAIKEFISTNVKNCKLIIGGFGPEWLSIQKYVKEHSLEDRIRLVGQLNQEEVAYFMKRSLAFIHPSYYETFSVVCAEALACGTPVITNAKGGVREFVNEENGIVSNNLRGIFDLFLLKNFNNSKIAKNAEKIFSEKKIGNEYIDILKKVCKKK